MSVLSDEGIRHRLAMSPSMIDGISPESYGSKSSKIQPCSVDLAVGEICLPVEGGYEESQNLRCSGHKLSVGGCVRIFTAESLNLTGIHKDIAAFVHAPARLTRRGLLMLDIAHIDPGFKGKLSFTVINVGAEQIELNQGDLIATVLFFEVSPPVKVSYDILKNDVKTYQGANEDIKCLAPDLLDIQKQARVVAAKVYEEKDSLKNKLVEAFFGLVAGAIFGVLGGYVGYTVWFQAEMNDRIRDNNDRIKENIEMSKTVERLTKTLDEMDKKVSPQHH